MSGKLAPEQVSEAMNSFGTSMQVRNNRFRVPVPHGRICDAIAAVQEKLACDRLITISTADTGSMLELIYHLTGPHRTVISLCVELPRDRPEAPTVSGMLPPAGIYERQIHDLFGISFTGHPGLTRIILNEDWPEGEHPLRKDWKPGPSTFYGGIKVERM